MRLKFRKGKKMVSTRGPKYKFSIGERVLCYEPDPSKAKVLYDSKVIGVVEGKDKKGRRSIDYLIHFQGWNSSWDRTVHEDAVLKDTDKNRQLQRELAEKSQLQIGAYLYRKERKKRKCNTNHLNPNEPKVFRPSTEDANSCCSTSVDVPDEEPEQPDEIVSTVSQSDDNESESCSSSAESVVEGDRVALVISENLRKILEHDYNMITKQNKLMSLPAKISVVTILENYVKYYSIKSICGPAHLEGGPRRRNSAAKHEKRERDYDKIQINIDLRKEVADGLRIYFDFLLKDYLLYKEELDQATKLLSPENLKNLTYVASEIQSLDSVLALKSGTSNPPTSISEQTDPQPSSSNANESTNEETASKRRLRSHKNTEENEFIFDLGAVTAPSIGGSSNHSSESGTQQQVPQMSSLALLRQLLPMNLAVSSKTRELLQNILSWQILPSDAPAEPSMVYGAIHLSRLIVKLPEFLNASPMPDDKLKLLLQYLDCFIEFLETHHKLETYLYVDETDTKEEASAPNL